MDRVLNSKGLKDSTEINICLSIRAQCEDSVSWKEVLKLIFFLTNVKEIEHFFWLYLGLVRNLIEKVGFRI